MERTKRQRGKDLVERDGVSEERVDDVGVVVELFVNHQGEDAHLSGTAIVQLDGELLVDGGLVPFGSLQLSSLDVILAGGKAKLDQADKTDDLGNTSSGDGVEGGKAALHRGEGDTISDFSWETNASRCNQVAEDGKLGNAAVLCLHGAEAIKALLVSILQKTQRIPEAYRNIKIK